MEGVWWGDIAVELKDPFDYSVYVKECKARDNEYMSMWDYGQRVGLMATALKSFPELTPQGAYLKLVEISNTPTGKGSSAKKKGGCCGKKGHERPVNVR